MTMKFSGEKDLRLLQKVELLWFFWLVTLVKNLKYKYNFNLFKKNFFKYFIFYHLKKKNKFNKKIHLIK
jgi:hypothetical protein